MIFDLTANSGKPKKLPVLNASYPLDASLTVIKGNTTSQTFQVEISEHGYPEVYTYQWYVNGSAVSGATGDSYTLSDLSETADYSVYCEVTNKAGTVRSRTATLAVTQLYTPTLDSSYPADTSFAFNGSTVLQAVIAEDGNPASYTYQWYKDGTAISGATSATYTYSPTAPETAAFYCEVTNAAGTVTSRTATMTATNLWLYDSGNEYTANTGGWTVIKTSSSQPGTKNSTNMYVYSGGSGGYGGMIATAKKIDLTKVKKLYINVTGVLGSGCAVYIGSSQSLSGGSVAYRTINSAQLASLDVSGVSGSYYVVITGHTSTGGGYVNKIYSTG